MRQLILLCLLFGTLSSTAHAGFWEDDKDNGCYNWNHEREACGRASMRRETQIAGLFSSYYGDHDASFSGSYGEGLIINTTKSYSSVRFLFGGEFLASSAKMYVSELTYNTTMMSANLMLGMSIKPYNDTLLQPVIEIDLLGGIKSIVVANPPTGVDEKNLKPSYGGKVSVGLDLKLWRMYAVRPALEYQYNRLSGVIDGKILNLDSLGITLGLVFF